MTGGLQKCGDLSHCVLSRPVPSRYPIIPTLTVSLCPVVSSCVQLCPVVSRCVPLCPVQVDGFPANFAAAASVARSVLTRACGRIMSSHTSGGRIETVLIFANPATNRLVRAVRSSMRHKSSPNPTFNSHLPSVIRTCIIILRCLYMSQACRFSDMCREQICREICQSRATLGGDNACSAPTQAVYPGQVGATQMTAGHQPPSLVRR